MTEPDLDLVTIGRASVDLYGQQIGGRLEDMAGFSKAVGGCPANIAIGAARLGLRTALVTRVGDEHMGRFIREQMEREGVSTRGIRTDPDRLTALVLLGVRDEHTFPLIFMRENCADAALDPDDVDEGLIASARATLVTGTHFAKANTDAAQRKAIAVAKQHGRKVVLDIDYRPNLWGLAGHGAGESRYVRSDQVSGHLASVLSACDLIVGTEEELHIAGGAEDTMDALRRVRALSPGALIVVKRGPMGCAAFPGPIPASLDEGVRGPGFPVEVYNVLGAGDAFLSGFLRGWLREEPVERCCAYANACGAFAVSRLLCSPESPTWPELEHFLRHGATERALRKDRSLTRIHLATTRRPAPNSLRILSVDHGPGDLETVARGLGADPARLPRFKILCVEAAADAARGRTGFGMFLDGELGREALFRAADHGFWVARQYPHDRADSVATDPWEWPVTQVVKTIANARADAPVPIERRLREIQRIAALCRAQSRELMVEALPTVPGGTPSLLAALYDEGLEPDWWLVEAEQAAGFAAAAAVVRTRDPHCRGFIAILRDLERPEALADAGRETLVRGVVAGRAVFGPVLRDWLGGAIDDSSARATLAGRFARLAEAWDAARAGTAA